MFTRKNYILEKRMGDTGIVIDKQIPIQAYIEPYSTDEDGFHPEAVLYYQDDHWKRLVYEYKLYSYSNGPTNLDFLSVLEARKQKCAHHKAQKMKGKYDCNPPLTSTHQALPNYFYPQANNPNTLHDLERLIDLVFFQYQSTNSFWQEVASIIFCLINPIPYAFSSLNLQGFDPKVVIALAMANAITISMFFYFIVDFLWQMMNQEAFFMKSDFFGKPKTQSQFIKERALLISTSMISAFSMTAFSYFYYQSSSWISISLLTAVFIGCFVARLASINLIFNDPMFYAYPFGMIYTELNQRFFQQEDTHRKLNSYTATLKKKFSTHIQKTILQALSDHTYWNPERWEYTAIPFNLDEQRNLIQGDNRESLHDFLNSTDCQTWLIRYQALKQHDHFPTPSTELTKNITAFAIFWLTIAFFSYISVIYLGFTAMFGGNKYAGLILTIISCYPLFMMDGLVGREGSHFYLEIFNNLHKKSSLSMPFYSKLYIKSLSAYILLSVFLASVYWIGSTSAIQSTLGTDKGWLYHVWTKAFTIPVSILDAFFICHVFFKSITHKIGENSAGPEASYLKLSNRLKLLPSAVDQMPNLRFLKMVQSIRKLQEADKDSPQTTANDARLVRLIGKFKTGIENEPTAELQKNIDTYKQR